jgi:hypothetical protein
MKNKFTRMKYIGRQGIALIILFLIFTGCSQKTSLGWIPFHWVGDTISGKYIEKAYMYIPVKIDDLPYDFTMQFDLGTYGTQFYGNAIQPYLNEYPSLANKLEAARGVEDIVFKHVNLQAGTVSFDDMDVWHRKDFGEAIAKDSILSATPKHIGTIAPDLFQDKILIIDYKAGRLAVADSLSAEYENLPAEEFGGQVLQNGTVYYDKEGLWEDVYNSLQVWGITGNAWFFNNTVIIDYKNKLFRVK